MALELYNALRDARAALRPGERIYVSRDQYICLNMKEVEDEANRLLKPFNHTYDPRLAHKIGDRIWVPTEEKK